MIINITTIFSALKQRIHILISYLYYISSTFYNNSYPLKFVGIKLENLDGYPLVKFKIKGTKKYYNLTLNEIFSDKNLISGFSPKDAFQLGRIAFTSIINNDNESANEEKFHKIINTMLSSVHDIYNFYQSFNFNAIRKENKILETHIDPEFISLIASNKYPYKLVNHRIDSRNNQITIIYTIFGKRAGFEKKLSYIIKSSTFLEKFHPTEAVKFGFIQAGNEFFIT